MPKIVPINDDIEAKLSNETTNQEDQITVEFHVKMEDRKKKMLFAGLFMLLLLIVIVIVLTASSSSSVASNVPYADLKSNTASQIAQTDGGSMRLPERSKAPTKAPEKVTWVILPTPRPTKQPTERPTRSPTRSPNPAPTKSPSPSPIQSPTSAPAPTTPAPTQDEIINAMCHGTSIINRKSSDIYKRVFSICPSRYNLKYIGGDIDIYKFSNLSLSKPLYKNPPSQIRVATNIGQILQQIGLSKEITDTHFSNGDPYWPISRTTIVNANNTDIRSILLYGSDDRFHSYRKFSRNFGLAVSVVVGRTHFLEQFKIEWTKKIVVDHLSPEFRDRIERLQQAGGDDISVDAFLRDFGTHYRKSAVFGGIFGVDYYFPGFGTKKDKASAVSDVLNADISLCLQQNLRNKDEFIDSKINGFQKINAKCYPWSEGGDPDALKESVDKWKNSFLGPVGPIKTVIIKEELVTFTDLMKIMKIHDVVLSKFADRIVDKARLDLKSRAQCMFEGSCNVGEMCIFNECIQSPTAPRWPDSVRFCLPKALDEPCPTSYIDEFYPGGWVYWDTENGNNNNGYYYGSDHISSHGLEAGQVNGYRDYSDGRNGGIQLYFCCQKPPASRVNPWPSGTYCLYAYRSVSILYHRNWTFISIVWNDEDDDNKNQFSQQHDIYSKVPLGLYDNYSSFTEQTLLCRNDGSPKEAIVLPKAKPFYLIQYGETCQEVYGMFWTPVQVTWDTENNHKSDEMVKWNHLKKIPRNCDEVCKENCLDIVPELFCYVGHDKIIINFCYYQEILTKSPTSAPTPPPIPPTRPPTPPSPPPTMYPTKKDPTPAPVKQPTPMPTPPTVPPTAPIPPPTPWPTKAPIPPSKSPTPSPTLSPTPPTPSPTPSPTLSPTSSPTLPCSECKFLQGVNIVGLSSIWPGDKQPTGKIFKTVDCFCNETDSMGQNCPLRFLVGDHMILEYFWHTNPIELRENDTLFRDITFFKGEKILKPRYDDDSLDVRTKTQIDLSHARSALTYGGSQRMINYGKVYSILRRHIGTNKNDFVFSPSHVVLRERRYQYIHVRWKREPNIRDLSTKFNDSCWDLFSDFTQGKSNHKDFDGFISEFGTHYVDYGIYGGLWGVDFYYTGYGTKPEMKTALYDIMQKDLFEEYRHFRTSEYDDERSGRSFIRKMDGKVEIGPDIKGWNYGGDQFGISKFYKDDHWRQSIEENRDQRKIIEHRKLVSISELLVIFSAVKPEFSSVRDDVKEIFLQRVVSKAHYWLLKHYRCFFFQYSCESKHHHPFPREAKDKNCKITTEKRLRTRTELEVCIGQENVNKGYMLKSSEGPNPFTKVTQWCENYKHTNYPPFIPVIRLMCPVVAPPPRWPVFFSYCFPKPVGSMQCPKEQFPEYDWNWDYELKIMTSFNRYQDTTLAKDWTIFNDFKDQLFSPPVMKNSLIENPYINVNPTSLIRSAYPWSYSYLDDPQGSQWENWYKKQESIIQTEEEEMQNTLASIHDAAENKRIFEYAEAAWQKDKKNITEEIKKRLFNLKEEKKKKEDVAFHYVRYLKNYNGSNTGQYYYFPKNKIYVLHQAPFLDFNGWLFWDTDDADYPGPYPKDPWDENWGAYFNWEEPKQGEKVTTTHKDVAFIFNKTDLVETYPKGQRQCHIQLDGRQDKWHDAQDCADWKEQLRLLTRLWPDRSRLQNNFQDGGIKMNFCCTTISEDQRNKATHYLHWPDGHLCIYAHGSIDSTSYKFDHGSVGWDCENGEGAEYKRAGNKMYLDPRNIALEFLTYSMTQQDRIAQAVPTGLYHIQFDGRSEQYFSTNILCMKENMDEERDIELPRDIPFYLMQQYQSNCQRVRGMHITNITLNWNTEKNHISARKSESYLEAFIELEMNSWGHATAYGRLDHIPKGIYTQQQIQINYCYYQPIVQNENRISNVFKKKDWEAVSMDYSGEYVFNYPNYNWPPTNDYYSYCEI